ncbi:AAA family ATPase [Streptomyces marianii]|uniref:Nuclease SbcCD subunit C n=1 Tax=Streptomyces marianii TaxID=1817406 RepID=A0A5R9EDH9_9ACTN|nr:SMC family ATPase [Streptomyces marianii]TLQ47227.1 SMC family ATPase [Streptomyces marianii]
MRLHRLEITAFGPFGARQRVDFDALSSAGLFLLHGPTGAGKTSVLDAVCYALYGAVPGARQSPGTSLRSDHASVGTYTEVCLDLTVGGRRLEITRQPAQPRPKKKGTGFTTEKAQSRLREYDAGRGEWKALSRSHQEIGEEIAQLVGMSRDQFCQVVLLPQGDFARFLRADAEARGKLLGRLFDTRRFALVEERLADLRRTAEQQVRDGDERLLALAHRMRQAAGSAAGDWPAPAHRPGEPGLAGAVLQWAAVARSGARESLAVAASARSAAETRQSDARRALDAERELAALQQRHADAVRRAGELEDRRPALERVRARLEQARKAELVGPALRLREEAEREHRAADTAWQQVRAALPAALVDAGAEELSGAERELRQELGGLDAARRAERRSADITREREELDRRARHDDGLLQEAEGWLADWDSVRRALQGRIEAAQDAATRAEHLAGRLEPARRRVSAARERDRLAALAEVVEDGLRTARERAYSARETWLDLKERRLRGIAAELASGLEPGRPCAVCGSAEHPAPAEAGSEHVDRAAEDTAYGAYAAADGDRAEAERQLAVLRGSFTAARDAARESGSADVRESGGPRTVPSRPEPGIPSPSAAPDDLRHSGRRNGSGDRTTAGETAPAPDGRRAEDVLSDTDPAPARAAAEGPPPHPVAVADHDGEVHGTAAGDDAAPAVADLESVVARLEREHRDAHALAAGTHAVREELARAEREYGERLAARQEAERRAVARTSRREALLNEQAALDAEVSRAVGGSGTVAERTALLERRIVLLSGAAEAVRAADTAALRLKEADDRLSDAAFRAGYDTPAEAAAALLADAEQHELQRRLDAWQAEEAAVADRLAEPEPRSAAGLPPAAPEAALHASDAAESALRDAVSALDSARERCAELDRLSRRAADEARGLGPLRDEYERVARLAGLTAGTSADNEHRMRLESYVLAARLEQVAAAASVRLQRMSAGRYTLVHSDARAGGKRSGLGLHVVDAWTGKERDTATLSGGETFFASLALALGLADVVTEEAGGVRLDTLFIDEGFGSLDDQTLDEVLDVLDSLRERDRSVGIVSHVGDLRRRIPAQLEVVKERDGSAVRLRSAPVGG